MIEICNNLQDIHNSLHSKSPQHDLLAATEQEEIFDEIENEDETDDFDSLETLNAMNLYMAVTEPTTSLQSEAKSLNRLISTCLLYTSDAADD